MSTVSSGASGRAVIVGGGIAALMAAWELAQLDVDVVLMAPTDPGQWPTISQGGLPIGDDVDRLIAETLACGEFLAPRAPVRALARNAGPLVERLSAIGVPFETDDGKLQRRRLPGMAQADAAHVGAHTEMAIAAAIERLVMGRWQRRIRVVEPMELMSLVVADGKCCGVVGKHVLTGEMHGFSADAVLLAGGGPERVLGARCGHLCPEAPLAIAARHGAVLVDMHRCHQHPAALSTARGLVVPSAAVRSHGARLWVPKETDDKRAPEDIPRKQRNRFLDVAFPDWAELVPDRIASERARELDGPLYLDLSHLPERHLEERLDVELEALRLASRLDPTRTALLVSPSPLGILGGLWVDHERSDDGALDPQSPRNHATSIPGLYAAGAVASLYHGSCQLGGNGLLADLFGGSTAGLAAVAYIALDNESSQDADTAIAEAVASSEEAYDERLESGFGEAHRAVISTLRIAVTDVLGAQDYELADTCAEIEDLETQLTAMPPEARAGTVRAAELHALESMLVVGRLAAHAAVRAESDPTAGRLLTRLVDDEVIVSDRLEVHGREITGAIDDDGIAKSPHDYGSPA